jgi:hypothetical protein
MPLHADTISIRNIRSLDRRENIKEKEAEIYSERVGEKEADIYSENVGEKVVNQTRLMNTIEGGEENKLLSSCEDSRLY